MNRAPEITKRAIMEPLFQSYSTPPKLIPMIKHTMAPMLRSEPRKSNFTRRPATETPGQGSKDGIRKRYIGARMAAKKTARRSVELSIEFKDERKTHG